MTTKNKAFFDKCKARNGSVHDGSRQEYALLEQPYISDSGNTFQATAVTIGMLNSADEDGEHDVLFDKHAMIFWNIIHHNITDDSDACDWDKPVNLENK